MIVIAEINTNILNNASQYLNEKRYGIGKNPNTLLSELKKRIIVKRIIESCSDEQLTNKIRTLIEKYN